MKLETYISNAIDIARMATDTIEGLDKIDRLVKQYTVGLITGQELIELL